MYTFKNYLSPLRRMYQCTVTKTLESFEQIIRILAYFSTTTWRVFVNIRSTVGRRNQVELKSIPNVYKNDRITAIRSILMSGIYKCPTKVYKSCIKHTVASSIAYSSTKRIVSVPQYHSATLRSGVLEYHSSK